MSNPMPPGFDLTALALGAAVLHEMFRSYVDAGFTEDQAIRLLAAVMAAYQQNGGKP
jgi:hypothetical protein